MIIWSCLWYHCEITSDISAPNKWIIKFISFLKKLIIYAIPWTRTWLILTPLNKSVSWNLAPEQVFDDHYFWQVIKCLITIISSIITLEALYEVREGVNRKRE